MGTRPCSIGETLGETYESSSAIFARRNESDVVVPTAPPPELPLAASGGSVRTTWLQNNIGVIRVPPEATVDVGGELDIPGRRPNAR